VSAEVIDAEFVPELRTDYASVTMGDEIVVWSPIRPEPVVLDPVAAVMLAVIDGEAAVRELAGEVHEEIGLALDVAHRQVSRIVEGFDRAGLLTTSTALGSATEAITRRSPHMHPMSFCSDKLSRERGMRSINLRFGDLGVRVACASRRGERILRRALGDHLVAEEQPLGFIVQKPRLRNRAFELLDRAGVELATAADLEPVLAVLAGHLASLAAPPGEGIRVRVAVAANGSGYVACVPPLLYVPSPDRAALAARGLTTIDRLAVDVTADGGAAIADIPWEALRRLGRPDGHADAAAVTPRLAAIAVAGDTARPSPAVALVELARSALNGTPEAVLDTLARAIGHTQLVSVSPFEVHELPRRLGIS
jgi:hypothetical protein